MKYNISEQELRQKYIDENYTISQCAEYFGCSGQPITNRLKQYGIKKGGHYSIKMNMTNEMYEVLRGTLLGDGSLLTSKNQNAFFSYTSKSLQHVQFVAKYFDEYKCGKGIYSYDIFDKRTNKVYQRNQFVTKRSNTLTKERDKWYINGIKHIPEDLVLTPLMCLLWYIGDGGLSNNTITLSTNCFEKEEIETILLPQLSMFEAKIAKCGRSKKEHNIQYVIKIYKRENVVSFLKYIGECPFEDYKYKWNVKPSQLKNYSQYTNEWIDLYKLNFATTKIALLYGSDHNTVRNILIKNGITIEDARNKGLFPPCDEWEELYAEGYSYDDIAAVYRCSPFVIKRFFDYIEINGDDCFRYKRRKLL